jgi:hypothetical protein
MPLHQPASGMKVAMRDGDGRGRRDVLGCTHIPVAGSDRRIGREGDLSGAAKTSLYLQKKTPER